MSGDWVKRGRRGVLFLLVGLFEKVPKFLLARGGGFGGAELEGKEEIAAGAILAGQTLILEAEGLPWLGAWRDGEGGLAVEGGDGEEGTGGGVPRVDIGSGVEIFAEKSESGVVGEIDGEEEAAPLAGLGIPSAAVGNSQFAALPCMGRNGDGEGGKGVPLDLGRGGFFLEGDGVGGTMDSIFEGDFEAGVEIEIVTRGLAGIERAGMRGRFVSGRLGGRLRRG